MKNLVNKIQKLEEEIERSEISKKQKYFLAEMKKVGIEKLPYAYSALKRFIDAETMDTHYNKHYKGYVDKLNLALNKRKFGDKELEQIVSTITQYNQTVRNNAGGAYNHALFWKMLSPKEQKPTGLILKKINKEFGSISAFKKKFETEAKERFGSGWVWLVITKNNRLKIMTTPNQDNPLMNDIEGGGYPILGLDLWEHAFYLKYKNKKDEYIKNFWKVVNWEFVEKLYKMKIETKITESVVLSSILKEEDEKLLFESIGTSEKCSPKDVTLYKSLMYPSDKEGSKFRELYVRRWKEILKLTFPDKWFEQNQLSQYFENNHMEGIYEKYLEGDNVNYIRSSLNYVTSNYTVLCIVHRDINKYLLKINERPIEFEVGSPKNISELNRMFDVLMSIRDRILNPETSNTFKRMFNTVECTDCRGRRSEQAAKQIIEAKYGKNTCKIIAGAGLQSDALEGVDAILTISGKSVKAQIKPFTHINLEEINSRKYYKVHGSAGSKQYKNVQIFVFVNVKDQKVVIFKNMGTIIGASSTYLFPESSKASEMSTKETLNIEDCLKYCKD